MGEMMNSVKTAGAGAAGWVVLTEYETASVDKPLGSDSTGMFEGDSPVHFSFSLLLIQIVIVLLVTRTLGFLMRPLKQPRVVGEILGGILLGPTALGRNSWYMGTFFPPQSMQVLQDFANMGLLLFLFVVGLELDVVALRRTGIQSASLAASGIVLPFGLAVAVSLLARKVVGSTSHPLPFAVFLAVAMADTAFPVLARILGERKLLKTELGQLAMPAAAINDVVAWVLLALAVGLSAQDTSPAVAAYTLACTLGFVLFSLFVTRRIMQLMISASPKEEGLKEFFICITFGILFLSGLATDVIGIHPVFGGFIFGLAIPKDGPTARILTEKLEDFVSIVLLPLYFASSGLKTSLGSIQGAASVGLIFLIIFTACSGKILGTMFVAYFQNIGLKKSFLLGVLMNTKGLTELVILNIGKDLGVLNDEIFAILVIMALTMTVSTTPILIFLYEPVQHVSTYERRSLDTVVGTEGLNILCCVHATGMKNMPSMFNLAETVRGLRNHDSMHVYMLQLQELSGRRSSLLPVSSTNDEGGSWWVCNPWKGNSGAAGKYRSIPFDPHGKLSKVTLKSLQAVSEFETMHEDVCNTAVEKQAAIVFLPYHKHQRVDGELEFSHPGRLTVNNKVLENPPCSVGILIDRGLGGTTIIPSQAVDLKAIVLFFGGPDDREALALGLRMSEHPGVKLNVVRFIPDPDDKTLLDNLERSVLSMLENRNVENLPRSTPSLADVGKSRSRMNSTNALHRFEAPKEPDTDLEDDQLDDAFCGALKGEPEIRFEEVALNDLRDILNVCANNQFHIILAGRNLRCPSRLLVAVVGQICEFTEVGPIGDILTEDQVRASVLIVQKFDYSTVANHIKYENSSKRMSQEYSGDAGA